MTARSIPTSRAAPMGAGSRRPRPLIHSLSFDELQRYDVGRIRPDSEYARQFPHQKPIDGTRIPRLSELFARAGSKLRFNIETKLSPEAPQETLPPEPFARALIAEIRKAGVEKRSTIQSFDWRTLKVVEREAPEIATAYLTGRRNPIRRPCTPPAAASGRPISPRSRRRTRPPQGGWA